MPIPTKIKDLIPLLELIPHPEGGFFVETFRSGCKPMTTLGQSGLDDCCEEPDRNLVVTKGRADKRPDKDERRNSLTSIFWVPTAKSPILFIATNFSDHIHYYQGGKPFRYYMFDPITGEFSTTVLGPELHKGQKLQVPVKGGLFKCGKIDDSEEEIDLGYDYSLIAEAVGPGFDFHDFAWVTKEMLNETVKDEKVKELLLGFVNAESTEIERDNKTVDAAAEFYEEGANQDQREAERA